MTPAEFWARVQPSGQTAEQELVAFWQRMLDCPCGSHPAPTALPPQRRRRPEVRKTRDLEDEIFAVLLR